MLRKTMLPRTLILSPLVVLLIVGLSAAGCGGRVSPTPAPPPTSPPEAASGPDISITIERPAPGSRQLRQLHGHERSGRPDGRGLQSTRQPQGKLPAGAESRCVARLEYKIAGWSAFWLKLQGADLSPYSKLVFDVKADPQAGIPRQMKLELKRGGEVSILYVSGIGADWKTVSVNLADFGSAGYGAPVSSWQGVEELVFTFEAAKSGPQGVVFLDNLTFVP